MKIKMDKSDLELIKNKILEVFLKAKVKYQRFDPAQRIAFVFMAVIIALSFVIFILNMTVTQKKVLTGHFEKISNTPSLISLDRIEAHRALREISALKVELEEIISRLNQQYGAIRIQLRSIQSNLLNLPSQQDVRSLQARVSEGNPNLLDKVTNLQTSMQKIVQRTSHIQVVRSAAVKDYFHLIAVQGFSDGLRAILEVAGHPIALAVNEFCPACRGWVLKKLHYSDQMAVFEKESKGHIFRVILRTD